MVRAGGTQRENPGPEHHEHRAVPHVVARPGPAEVGVDERGTHPRAWVGVRHVHDPGDPAPDRALEQLRAAPTPGSERVLRQRLAAAVRVLTPVSTRPLRTSACYKGAAPPVGTLEHVVNRLAKATSPYLLQHAENPVDWWEWGEDAFGEARRLDRPVLLSVG